MSKDNLRGTKRFLLALRPRQNIKFHPTCHSPVHSNDGCYGTDQNPYHATVPSCSFPLLFYWISGQFLTRISLPRLIHFLDLVLPQLMPVQAAWVGEEKTLWSCHYIRWLREKQSAATPRVQISYFFSSHDNVHHVRIQWNSNPLLLFSDPLMVEALPVEHFRQQASHMTHQQHLQMGLRKGMAIL